MAFERHFVHYSRRTPWLGGVSAPRLLILGENWSAATAVMTLAAEQGGTALITLNTTAPGSQGVSIAWDATYERDGVEVGASTITVQIDEATFEGLPWGADPAAPLVLTYDLLVTPSGAAQRAFCWGTLTIYRGVGD